MRSSCCVCGGRRTATSCCPSPALPLLLPASPPVALPSPNRVAFSPPQGAKQDDDDDEDEGEDERLARDVLTPRRVEVAPLRVVRLSASGDGSSAEGEGGRCFRWGVWREGEAGARGRR